ncbi:MAG: helix-hairpin-helix domain-containing protein [Promethearchaeota archaeon]|jgi:ribosomal protein S13
MTSLQEDLKKEKEKRLYYDLIQDQDEITAIDIALLDPSQPLNTSIGKQDLTNINGVGESVAEKLKNAGFDTIDKIAHLEITQLSSIKGIGETSARKIIEAAKMITSRTNLNKFSIAQDVEQLENKSIETLQQKWYDELDESESHVEVSALRKVSFDHDDEGPEIIPEVQSVSKSPTLQEEKVDLLERKLIVSKIIESLNDKGYQIVKNSHELKPISTLVDVLAVKVVRFNELLDFVIILPLKLNHLKGELQISNKMIKYKPDHENFKQDGAVFKILLDTYFDQLHESHEIIHNELHNGGTFAAYLNTHQNINISVKKTLFNKSLFFSSGPQQIRILIEPILLCQGKTGFLEKILPFAYLRDINTHIVQVSQLPKLLKFLENKYYLLEEHQRNDLYLASYESTQKTFWKRIEYLSVPFMGYAGILIMMILLQSYGILNLLMDIGYALFGIYAITNIYLFLKFLKRKSEISSEFATPYYKKTPQIDETSLVLINEELSPDMMSQFVYECFGKGSESKFITQLEEDRVQARVQKQHLQAQVTNGHFFEKEEVKEQESEFINKYRSFLED